jgi:hypothetical protein
MISTGCCRKNAPAPSVHYQAQSLGNRRTVANLGRVEEARLDEGMKMFIVDRDANGPPGPFSARGGPARQVGARMDARR